MGRAANLGASTMPTAPVACPQAAADNAASATEEARAHLAGLQLPEALAKLQLPSGAGLGRLCAYASLASFSCVTSSTLRFPSQFLPFHDYLCHHDAF